MRPKVRGSTSSLLRRAITLSNLGRPDSRVGTANRTPWDDDQMAHRRAQVVVAVAGAVVLAVAPAGAQRPHGRGALTVSQRFDLSKGLPYIEGSMSYLKIRRHGRTVLQRVRQGPFRVRLRPRAGLYRVVSFQRPCDGNCSLLDPPTDRCSRRVRVYTGERAGVRIVTRPGRGCVIRV